MAVEEYSHLSVNIELGGAIEMIRRCCETIRTTDFSVRKDAPGKDIAVLMNSQHGLCSRFSSRMYEQLYSLGREVNVKGMENPFMIDRSRKSATGKGQKVNPNNTSVCYQLDGVGPESTESLQNRCKIWWLSELYERTVDEARNKQLQKMYVY